MDIRYSAEIYDEFGTSLWFKGRKGEEGTLYEKGADPDIGGMLENK